ncbi:MAG: hypothetical protein HY868_11880 [Chloroflexi bacterium]|nr:hypothetical protein [Chloroflexota bacterium]
MFRLLGRTKRASDPLHFLAKLGVGLFFVFVFGIATAQSSEPPDHSATLPTRRAPTASRTYSPTASRTPTRTNPIRAPRAPHLMPGQTTMDAYTVALYHFDSTSDMTAIDETGNYTGTFSSGASVSANGLYAGGLYLDRAQQGYVSLGNYGNQPQGTVEMFVDFLHACTQTSDHFTLLSAGSGFGGAQNLWVGVEGFIKFKIFVNGSWEWVDSGINPCRYLIGGNLAPYWAELTPYPTNTWPYETWRMHHLAITWGARGMELWVDGVLHGIGASTTPEANTYAYRCNPQMQLSSWRYPLCATPVLNVSAPYSYKGGLPAYSTMLLGCDVPGNCFNGIIDEVRVSNLQRTFAPSIIPTTTPLPTSTPVAPVGEYSVDGYTASLFHMSDITPGLLKMTKNEVTQTYSARLNGNAIITANGRFNNGIYLDGTLDRDGVPSFLDAGHSDIQGGGAFEIWVNFSSLPNIGTLVNGGGGFQDIVNVATLQLNLVNKGNGTHQLEFRIYDRNISDWRIAGTTVPSATFAGTWHHIAATWGGRGMELWIDGVRAATYPYGGFPAGVEKFLIGSGQSGYNITGTIDEFRVNTIQRTFVPPITPTPSITPTPTNTRPPTPGTYYVPLVER